MECGPDKFAHYCPNHGNTLDLGQFVDAVVAALTEGAEPTMNRTSEISNQKSGTNPAPKTAKPLDFVPPGHVVRRAERATTGTGAWRDIETAPKDGLAVLGFGVHSHSPEDAARVAMRATDADLRAALKEFVDRAVVLEPATDSLSVLSAVNQLQKLVKDVLAWVERDVLVAALTARPEAGYCGLCQRSTDDHAENCPRVDPRYAKAMTARPEAAPTKCPQCGHTAHWEACTQLDADGYCHCNHVTGEKSASPRPSEAGAALVVARLNAALQAVSHFHDCGLHDGGECDCEINVVIAALKEARDILAARPALPATGTAPSSVRRVLEQLPDLFAPEIRLEDDGEIGFDWDQGSDCVLSLSLNESTGMVGWSGLFDGYKGHGRCDAYAFSEELRDVLASYGKAESAAAIKQHQPMAATGTGAWQHEELWRPVVGYEGRYEVSPDGHVRDQHRRIIGQWLNADGYLLVRLSQPRAMKRVHRLVAEAWIPNTENKPSINHKDSRRDNNRISNLEWCDQAENLAHARASGRMPNDYWKGRRSPKAKLDDEVVAEVRRLHATGMSWQNIATQVGGVSKRTVGRIVRGETYV